MTVPLNESQKVVISSPQIAYELMKDVLAERDDIDKDRENAWIIALDNANKVLDIELISMGTQNRTLIDPKEVFCKPLRNRAASIILVHNHPSGNRVPSLSDIDSTDGLMQVGRLVSIPIIDHIILLDDEYFSFVGFDLIDLLKKYSFYAPICESNDKEEIIAKRIEFCIKKLKSISKLKLEKQKDISYNKLGLK